jgi:hypothetical protein
LQNHDNAADSEALVIESLESAKERLAALERMKKARSIGIQTTQNDKHNREVFDNAALTVKFDADGIPSLAFQSSWHSSSSSSLSSSMATASFSSSPSVHIWLLPCLRRPMLCYSGQKATLLPPHLFLAYFQEILHYTLRFPIHPDFSVADRASSVSAASATVTASAVTSTAPLSLQATVENMRQLRKSSINPAPAASSSQLASLSSENFKSAHKSVKASWCTQAAAFDGFGPGQSSFPDFALKFFQSLFGQKQSADIM